MYYTHPGCRTSILGENRAYCIRDFTVCTIELHFSVDKNHVNLRQL